MMELDKPTEEKYNSSIHWEENVWELRTCIELRKIIEMRIKEDPIMALQHGLITINRLMF